MGVAHAKLVLTNPRFPELEPVEAVALADSGAVQMCVPLHVALQLKLEEYDQKEVTLADGTRRLVPYMGLILTKLKNRTALVGALVMGDEVLLGAIPMEDMDLVILPKHRRVDVNPENPNVACSLAKGFRS